MKTPAILVATLLLILASLHAGDWKSELRRELPLLGHRNWIVIADSAYPWQVSPGITTIETGASQTEVIKAVLGQLGRTRHVVPTVMIDRELDAVTDKASPGIGAYRMELAEILGGKETVIMPHEEIIRKLDEAGKTFHVLILKTTMTKPYTSVFLQLQCGYWDAKREKELRRTSNIAGFDQHR
jgi:L-fucose mutarotase/ribose pyranase (RbsD/FucU family)